MGSPNAIPCRRCAEPTFMHSTKLCDHCWEKNRHGVFELQDALMAVVKGGNYWRSWLPQSTVKLIEACIGPLIEAEQKRVADLNATVIENGPPPTSSDTVWLARFPKLCGHVLGEHGKVTGYMLQDQAGMARCAFDRPCPEHKQ